VPPFEERSEWRHFWLVDPLDGTKEFVSGSGEFTVNIALIVDGEPVLGVVGAPALNAICIAARGCGSWRCVSGGAFELLSTRRD
jgi:3'(2'), 5'-bisphosphate nucleotidase